MYEEPLKQRKTARPKVSFNPQFDRVLKKAAHKADIQYAPYLRRLVEWAVLNGAIEEIQEEVENKLTAA